MDDTGLVIDRQGFTTVLRLNRPRVRNALGSRLVAALSEALEAAEDDAAVRVIVLHGSDPGFCAGSDLKELAAASLGGMRLHERRSSELTRRIASMSKPVIAAVEGFAIGGGFFLAAACDIVVSGVGATWSLPEVELGWVPPWGLQLLAARVGAAAARRLTWGLEKLSAAEAHRLGAVDVLVDDGDAFARASALATRLAAMPPIAVQATKRSFVPLVLGAAEAIDEDALDRVVAAAATAEGVSSLDRFRPQS